MLKNPPYSRPGRMGTIYTRVTGFRAYDERHDLDGEQRELLRDGVPALISAVSGGTSGVNLQAASGVQYVHDGRVSAHYFDVLAVHPLMGRNFSEDEEKRRSNVIACVFPRAHDNPSTFPDIDIKSPPAPPLPAPSSLASTAEAHSLPLQRHFGRVY
jgi:hypothetical protein